MIRVLRIVLLSLSLIGGFAFGSGILRRINPVLDNGGIREKLSYFGEHADEYDTLFFGSSRVFRQISPLAFDKISHDAGLATRSFNFGMDGMFPPEDGYVADQIFSLRPKNLRWVFLEVNMFLPAHAEKNPESPRSIYWHDLRRTSLTLRDIVSQTESFDWKKRKKREKKWLNSLERCAMHIDMFARNTAQVGQGSSWLSEAISPKKKKFVPASVLGDNHDGYIPLDLPKGMPPGEEKQYDKLFAEQAQRPIRYEVFSPAAQENFERILSRIYKAGATPVLIVSPSLSQMVFVPRKPAKELYLDFSDLHAWPELFRKEHRADYSHLSKTGAEIYTRYIAEAWLSASLRRPSDVSQATLPETSGLDAGASNP